MIAIDSGALAAAIHKLKPVPGVDAVLLPGERSRISDTWRRENGVPLVRGTVAKLAELATRFGIAAPEPLEKPSGH